MNANLYLKTEEFNVEGKMNTVVVLQINNEDYDES